MGRRRSGAAVGVEKKVVHIIEDVLRYWFSLRLGILIALDTTEIAGEEEGAGPIAWPLLF